MPDGGNRRLTDPDDADLGGLDQRDREPGSKNLRERGRRHPARGTAAGNDDRSNFLTHRRTRMSHQMSARLFSRESLKPVTDGLVNRFPLFHILQGRAVSDSQLYRQAAGRHEIWHHSATHRSPPSRTQAKFTKAICTALSIKLASSRMCS